APETWIKWQALVKTGGLDSRKEAHWNILRFALLDFIADFANWDNSTVKQYLDASRALTQAAHEALGGEAGTRPLVVDPFAGGGSIPLEALRVGADAFASDLNPIPVLLNKVVLEYIPKFGKRLAGEVRKRGEWIRQEAEKKLARFYPTDSEGGVPIAYIWARTILSDAPGTDPIPIEIPLLSSMWLSKKPNRGRALRWVRDSNGTVQSKIVEKLYVDGRRFRVRQPLLEVFEPNRPSEVEPGTVRRGSTTCPVSGFTTQVARVREQLQQRKGGTRDSRLICVVTTRTAHQGRFYRNPCDEDITATNAAEVELSNILSKSEERIVSVPNETISLNEIRRISVPIYGMSTWGDVFSARQLLALITIVKLVRESGDSAIDANSENKMFDDAVQTLLALNVGKAADYGSALSTWSSPASQETVRNTFSRQAIGMVWDYAEANPFAASSGGWSHNLGFIDKLIVAVADSELSVAQIEQASATHHPLPDDSVQAVITDPPYYDAVPYAHLSDFFYVWLRRVLPEVWAPLFAADAAPKGAEIVVDRPHYLSNSNKDIAFYEHELTSAFAEARRICTQDGIGAIVFASKTTASWEAILKGVIDAGWIITASWPIDTEREGRMAAIGQARLASSVHLVCRPRGGSDNSMGLDEVGDWRAILQELPQRIHSWMPRLAGEGVVGADAIFACLGPALEVFSRYSRVEKANGEAVTLKEYLEHVWAAVAKEALAQVFKGADATGFEPDARLTAMWLWTLKTPDENGKANSEEEDDEDAEGETKKPKTGGFKLEYDAARKIAQGLGAVLEGMTHLVEVKGDEARLLPVVERTRHLFGKEEEEPARAARKKASAQMNIFAELTGGDDAEMAWREKTVKRVGETTLDRVHQAMILFAAGRGEALKRFVVDDGVGRDGKFWRLADALNALYPAGSDERRWVEGVLARKKQFGF
ncbi:MAG TPA: hypothetical protein VGF01_13890, partial [Terracidiphilus sp.]